MKHLKQKLLLTALLLLAVVNVNAEVLTGSCGANLTYTLDTETGILKIEGTGRMDDYDYLSPNRAPWYSKRSMVKQLELSYGITYIGKYAFENNYFTSVSIPSSVTSIGENAFYDCFKLASVDIPNSVTSIGKRAFGKCSKLTSIEIPNSVTSLGESAFQETGLTYISLPNSITSISDYAFRWCSSLASIDIPNSVTSIGERAFGGCSSLTSIDFLNSVTSIGKYAFEFCENIASIEIPNSVTSIGELAFYNCWNLTSITIGNSVTLIGNDAFGGCEALSVANYASIESLLSINFGSSRSNPLCYSGRLYINGVEATDLEIPNNVTSIGKYAFYNCSSLTSVIIPNSVTSIGYGAFYKCNGLTSVTIGNSVTSIEGSAFAGCEALSMVNYASIESLLSINFGNDSSNPLWYSGRLYINGVEATDLEIPNNVTSIGKYAFYNCSSLTSVIIPNSVTSIGKDAFYNCSSLTSVTIGNSVTSIEDYAFSGCSSLTSVIIPNSVTSIGYNAFAYCNGLTSVTIRCTTPPATNSGFYSTPIESATLYVPESSIETYQSTSPWSGFGQILPYQATKIELTDATPVSYITDNYYDELDYTRTFNNTNWQALYVPFSMNYEDWAEDFEVARLNNVNQYDDDNDGTVDRTVLEVIKLAEGSKTEANTPYMIKAKETGEKTITVADATLYKTEETSHDVTSWETKFTFTGTYHTVTDMATNGYYALAGGRLQQATSDAVTLSPMRWYLSVTDRNGNPQGLAKSISVVIDGGETTGISEVNTITTRSNAIYSINGSYIGTDRSKLTKGIYVSGGKKIIIK